jgi:flagellar P-ring protein precursor FlgI
MLGFWLLAVAAYAETGERGIRIKDLARVAGAQDNALVGYGIVTGLAGTGDSFRNPQTLQTVRNFLLRSGVNLPDGAVRSRNVATVAVTATLPMYARPGDKIEVNVTSLGDARSLVGGTLLMTDLTGPNNRIYAIAQGPVSVGGFKYDLFGNVVQKNHPAAGTIPEGASVEQEVPVHLADPDGQIEYVLHTPDITTASRIADTINSRFRGVTAEAVSPARVQIASDLQDGGMLMRFLTQVENLVVTPDTKARVVVNERTGTVVSGGGARISAVTINHGDLRVDISTQYLVSQPYLFGFARPGPGVGTRVVPQTDIEVDEQPSINVSLPRESSVDDLVSALNRVKATSRDIISILQALKRAGALHAELIIQ